MKVLTMVSSIFVPMTFIAGVYGMNFEYMPELSHPWAYPLALGTMLGSAVLMMYYFLRKGWFGSVGLRVGAAMEGLNINFSAPAAECEPPPRPEAEGETMMERLPDGFPTPNSKAA